MSQLSFSAAPTFADLADSAIGKNQVLTDDAIQKISHNAKFAAVRYELIFLGFFKHGDTVGYHAPSAAIVSPVDGYSYSGSEILYECALYSTRAPGANFISGQTTAPPIASGQSGNPYWYTCDVSTAGVVAINVNYTTVFSPTNDGIVKVWAHCQRTMPALAAPPLFVDVPDDLLVVAQPLRESAIQAISRNAKAGAVREEVFAQGFWAGGYSVTLPVSPVDGYKYSRSEMRYRAVLYSTLAPAGSFANGQTTVPTIGNGQLTTRAGKGPLYWWTADIEDKTGVTATTVSYYVQNGAESIYIGDGILKVFAIGQRGSTNIAGPVDPGGGGTGIGGIGGSTGGNTGIPDAPTVAAIRSLAQIGASRYELTVGVQAPANPANWTFLIDNPLDLQITPDATFATFPAGQSLNIVNSFLRPPINVEFATNYPGTYYIRARVWNPHGPSAWGTISYTTDILDSLTDDTDLMAAPTPVLTTNAGGAHPELAGNEVFTAFEVPVLNSATYFGYTCFYHNSATLPTATTQETGTAGSVTSGDPSLTDLTKSWTPGAWVGKDVVAFSTKRGASPTFDYEGQIIMATITANTSTKLSFAAKQQNLHHTLTGLKYYIVNHGAGHHFWEKVLATTPCIVDEGLTGGPTLEQSGRVRSFKYPSGFAPVYAWVVLYNTFGVGRATASPPNATFDGITTAELKDLAVITQKLSGSGAGTGAVTAPKTNIINLGDLTLQLGTVQTGKLQTASSGQRIEIDGTNGLRGFGPGGELIARISLGGTAAGVLAHAVYGVPAVGGIYQSPPSSTPAIIFDTDGGALWFYSSAYGLKLTSSALTVQNAVVFTGSGAGLTNIPDSGLSSNVPLKNAANTFTQPITMTSQNILFSNAFGLTANGGATALSLVSDGPELYSASTLRAKFGSDTQITISGTRYTLTRDASGFVKA